MTKRTPSCYIAPCQALRDDIFRKIPDLDGLVKKFLKRRARLSDVVLLGRFLEIVPVLKSALEGYSGVHVNLLRMEFIEPIEEICGHFENLQQLIATTLDFSTPGEIVIAPSFDEELQDLAVRYYARVCRVCSRGRAVQCCARVRVCGVVLCCAVLCCVVLCCVVLCCVVLCCVVLCCVVLCCVVLCCVVLCCVVLCCVVLCCVVLCCVVLCCVVLCCVVLCCVVLCCVVLCCVVLCCVVLCCVVLCCVVLCCVVLCVFELCCPVVWCGVVWCVSGCLIFFWITFGCLIGPDDIGAHRPLIPACC